jgi:hypothetical protein
MDNKVLSNNLLEEMRCYIAEKPSQQVQEQQSETSGYTTGQACIGVSDGSVRSDRGAFGWCLSQSDGRSLVTGMGPAQGMAPSSYRAEGYGMLAILRFIVRLCEFCGGDPLTSTLYCDNLALVT